MTNLKINQAQIDELLKSSSDQQQQQKKPKAKPNTRKVQKKQSVKDPRLNKKQSKGRGKEDSYGEDFQEEIDEEEEENVPEKGKGKNKKNEDSDNYGDDFEPNESQNKPNTANNIEQQQQDEIAQQSQSHKSKPQSQNLGSQLQNIESEHASENIDEVAESLAGSKSKSRSHNEEDDDLSLAQSEFIQSGKLDQGRPGMVKKISKEKLGNRDKIGTTGNIDKDKGKQIQKEKIGQKQKEIKRVQRKIKKQPKQPSKQKLKPKPKQPATQKPKPTPSESQVPKTKQKRSEQQILDSLNQIKQQKKALEEQKAKKKLEEELERKKIYEEALVKEKEQREKNKAIMRQQKERQKDKTMSKMGKSDRKIDGDEKEPRDADFQAKQQLQKQKNEPKNFLYKQMKKQRIQKQKQIQQKITEQNKKKLKNLESQTQPQPQKLKGEQNKKQFIKVRQNLKQAKIQQKRQQEKQEDVVLIKKIKKEIAENKEENRLKQKKIFQFDKIIQGLRKEFKEKEKEYYQVFNNVSVSGGKEAKEGKEDRDDVPVSSTNFSDLSPIQKFITYFPQAKTAQQIFQLLDTNNDGLLTTAQILTKLSQQNLPQPIIQQLHSLLDRNSDGNVTREEFAFNIEAEIQRQADYRLIMGELEITDPIQVEARIIDMRAKIGWMEGKIRSEGEQDGNVYEVKYKEYLDKIAKIEQRSRKQKADNKDIANTLLNTDSSARLHRQFSTLQTQQKIQQKLLQTLKSSLSTNLNNKNKILMARVEENLKIKEAVYRIRNQIQELQLRFLSSKKIEENKRGYLEKRSKERAKMEELFMKTKEYQLKIGDPTKESVNKRFAREAEFLAAVVMIQRNFRARKARRQAEQKKQSLK